MQTILKEKLKLFLVGVFLMASSIFLFHETDVYAAPFLTGVGGTGTTSPSGILYGDNGATNHLNTTIIGSGLTFSGGTLSATGGGSGTVGAGTTGQFPFYNANGTVLTATSSLFILPNGNIGIGSTTPWANLSVQDQPGAPISQPIFSVGSSTVGVNAFTVFPDGYIQAGPLVSKDTAFCTFGKLCLGYFGSDNTLSGTNIEEGNYSPGGSAYGGFTALNNLDDATGAHYAFFGLTSSNYNDPTFGTSQAFPNQMQLVNSDGQIVIQANFNGTTTVPTANNIIFTVNGTSLANEVGRFTNIGLGLGSTTPGSLLSIGNTGWNFYDNATTTDSGAGGLNIQAGCYAIAGICIGSGGGGSGTVNAGLQGQNAFYNTNGTAVSATSTLFIAQNQNVGFGTTSPYAQVNIATPNGQLANNNGGQSVLFAVSSSTAGVSTTTLFDVRTTGATATQGNLLGGVVDINSYLNCIATAGSCQFNYQNSPRITFASTGITFAAPAQNTTAPLTFIGNAAAALTADANIPVMNFNFAQTRTHATGAVTQSDEMQINSGTEAFAAGTAAASVITTADTLTIPSMPLVGTRGSITNRIGVYLYPGTIQDGTGNGAVASSTNDTTLFVAGDDLQYNTSNNVRSGAAAIFTYDGSKPGLVGFFNGSPNVLDVGTSTPSATDEVLIENLPAQLQLSTTNTAGYSPTGSIFRIASTTNSTQTTDFTVFTALQNGNVGIGTSSPWTVLSTEGTVAMHNLSAFATGDSAVCQRPSGLITFDSGVSSCIISSIFAKNYQADDTYQQAKARLAKLRVVLFSYKDGGQNDIGLFAEEAAKVDHRYAQYATAPRDIDGHHFNIGDPVAINWTAIQADMLMVEQYDMENTTTASVTKSVEDSWQWLAIGFLLLGFFYQQVQINRLKK